MSKFVLKPPLFLVGFKSYREAVGQNAVKMAKMAAEVSKGTEVCVMIMPQTADIYRIAQNVEIPILAQHVDPVPHGGYAAAVLAEAVKEAGAVGSLINHKDLKLKIQDLQRVVSRTREVGLISAVCADSPEEAQMISLLNPDIIIPELPELIGTKTAVTKADTKFVTDSIRLIKKYGPKVLVAIGAGINTGDDAGAAIRLGADGAGASKGIVTSENPMQTMKDMIYAIQREWKARKE